MSPSERKVGETILANPQAAIAWSIAEAAGFSGVSEPSIMRFCRKLGFDGYADFRIKFAQAVALIERSERPIDDVGDDPIRTRVIEHSNSAITAINDLILDVDSASLKAAADTLARARRIDIYGHGGSGFLAGEAQHRLAYLGLPSVAYSDPSLQMFSAVSLQKQDVVLAFSFSGITTHMLPNLEIAREAGATIISLAPTASPIAKAATINIAINAYRQKKSPGLRTNERLTMYIMLDVLIDLISASRTNS
jgi:RpiR family carbohydrate utilization transcriptional regulator